MTWDNQVIVANRQMRQAQHAATLPAAPTQYLQQHPEQPGRKSQCEALDERVRHLDSMGRAGSLYYDLDWIRSQRKDARDRQFRLRC